VALPQPCLALIADRFTNEEAAGRAVTAVEAGVRWVHLRDHDAPDEDFYPAAADLAERLRARAAGITITVNTRLRTAEALEAGLHVGRRGPTAEQARSTLGPDALIGYSAHEVIDVESERARHVDYFFFSPVYPTPSKPDHPGAGTGLLRRVCRAARPTPVVALGGITPERVTECREAGARGVAVLSGIMHADAPAAAARAYLRALSPVA
jgi:thiamine-phosphate pyrophosphorylase